MLSNATAVGGFIILVGMYVAAAAAWITHIAWSINLLLAATEQVVGYYILAVLGTLFAPLGIIHGVILWVS